MKRPAGFDGRATSRKRPQTTHAPPEPEPAAQAAPVAQPVPVTQAASVEQSAPVVPTEAALPTAPERDAQRAPAASGVREAQRQLRQAGRSRRVRERNEQRRFTSHRRARRRRWLIGIGAVVGLALFVIAGVYTPLMAVQQVRVEGVQTLNAEDVQQALSRFEGVPLALVDEREVHRALEPFALIQRYAIERIPPHTLVVRVQERAPVIALEREDGLELLDPAGVLLAKVDERPTGVPVGSAELSDTSSPAFRAAAAIIRDLPADVRGMLTTVHASNAQNVSFTLDSGTELVWGDAKNTQRKAVVFRSLVAAIGTPSTIDVSAPEAPVFS